MAIESWLEVVVELPCNVRLLIEGEEEIGFRNSFYSIAPWIGSGRDDAIIVVGSTH